MPCRSKLCPVDTVHHLVDPDLWVEIFFKKERATEKGKVYFEIGDSDGSAS